MTPGGLLHPVYEFDKHPVARYNDAHDTTVIYPVADDWVLCARFGAA